MERRFMGSGRAKMWTYLILAVVLLVGTVVGNLVHNEPDLAQEGVDAFMGLPHYAYPILAIAIGLLVFALGLKLETDWPEGIGALAVAGGIAGGQMLIGWDRFELGGLVVVPYIIPIAVFLLMMGVSIAKSR